MDEKNIKALQDNLLSWFTYQGRAFPWRIQVDPYAVLIAEKLLQQTAARDIVVNVYDIFLHCYPSPAQLAVANLEDVKRIIQPLGLTYRAKDLIQMAYEIVDKFNGEIPRDLSNLLSLSGVGDYIARAVLSLAFNQDIPIVDTNVARFLYRIYGIDSKLPKNPSRKIDLIDKAKKLIPAGKSKEFNLAILDLCALVCTLNVPHCEECPVLPFCAYGREKFNPGLSEKNLADSQ